jgi:putative tributyrin esterase
MALMTCNFYSESLGISTAMNVILPQQTSSQIGMKSQGNSGKHKTLYLLHGLSDDHTIWLRRTSIERYAAALGIAVVMPAVNRSFYTNMHYGAAYWTFISEELPELARSFFPLSDLREDNFVAGLSMGGYGAFKLALRCPERFSAAASLSGAMDIKTGQHRFANDYKLIFGGVDIDPPAEEDLFQLMQRVKDNRISIPRLYQYCGTEDFLYEDNIKFRDFAQRLGIPVKYEESPGSHEWQYWDDRIQDVLKCFFP